MNVSQTFIERPIATTLLMVAVLVFGSVAYRALPVNDLPTVDFPTLLVQASLPGASPETMAAAVATPMERQFSQIAGIDTITSTNSLGSTQVTLQFELDRDLDAAAQDVQTAITQAAPLLPPGMPTPPTFRKVNPADQPILYLALTSTSMPMYALNEYADTMIAQRISTVSGVAQVQVMGQQKYSVRVQMDPQALASRRIGVNEVEAALRNWNVNLPTGVLQGPDRAYTLQATGQLTSAEAFRRIIVAYRNGSPVRLEELGNVIDSVEEDKTASWFYTREASGRAIVLAVLRQPGTNTIEITDRVRTLFPIFEQQLPPSVKLGILYDRSKSIRESYEDVKFTMLLTLGLVVMVIFLFLRNVPATIIPSLALPFSVIGTFAVMYLCGFTLNNLSMMALILSIGFVVDDAIVMLENIVRHIELGETPMAAALKGSKEIAFTIVSMTLSLAAVFIPVLFMGGILGRLFKEFAVTICAAILISGVISVTLTPMMCSRLLKHHTPESHGALFRMTERVFEGMLRLYDVTLRWTLRHRALTMAVSLLIVVATGWLFVRIPKGFIPDEDKDQIFIVTEAAQGTGFEQMVANQQKLARIIQQEPIIEGFMSGVGSSSVSNLGANSGRIFVHLIPRAHRAPVDEVIQDLRGKLSSVPGMRAFLQNPPSIRLGGQLSKSLYQVTLQGTEVDELYREAQRMEGEIATIPGLQDVTTDLQIKNPELKVSIDRDKAAAVQVNANQIENSLYSAFGPRWVSTIYAANNQYRVLLELTPKYQGDPASLDMLYVKSSADTLVPLSTIAKLDEQVGPQTINHLGQLPAVTISYNLRPGVALGDAVNAIREKTDSLPPTISASFQGAAKAFADSLAGLSILLVVAIAVVYIVLGVLYESYVHPITILSGLPSAGFGALLTLSLFNLDLNIYGFVGLIMLIGIVKKNAIMQIDFALEAERNEGKSPRDAIYQGCLVRFRPIMMTTMAALLGAVPLAIGYGAGGEARRPLGLTVVGGLIFSQIVTLYLTPVFYTYMSQLQEWVQARRTKKVATPAFTD